MKKLPYKRMLESEQDLHTKVEEKTAELQQAQEKVEQYSKTLEQKVAARTAELSETNKQLQNEIKIRKEAEANKEMLILDLQKKLKEIKTLRGLLPICSSCKKIRDDKGYWNKIEGYIQKYSHAKFTYGICPECLDKLYGKEEWFIREKDNII